MRIKALVMIAIALSVWGCKKEKFNKPQLIGDAATATAIVDMPDDDIALRVVREPVTGACWIVATGYRTMAIHPSACPPAEER